MVNRDSQIPARGRGMDHGVCDTHFAAVHPAHSSGSDPTSSPQGVDGSPSAPTTTQVQEAPIASSTQVLVNESAPEQSGGRATASDVTCDLVRLQRLRIMHIKRQQLINLPIKAMIKTFVGFSTFGEPAAMNIAKARASAIWDYLENEANRAKAKGECERIVKIIKSGAKNYPRYPTIPEKMPDLPPEDMQAVEDLMVDVFDAMNELDRISLRRDQIEKKMMEIASGLPYAHIVDTIPGLSLKGVAIVVAEARGDLETFRSPTALWKRLGWATDGFKAQTDCSKVRKAQVYGCLTESMFKAQSKQVFSECAECNAKIKSSMMSRHIKKDHNLTSDLYCVKYNIKNLKEHRTDEVAVPEGVYRSIYDRARLRFDAKNEAGEYRDRAEYELTRNPGAVVATKKIWQAGRLTNKHLHTRAMRVMIKALLVDLWRVSRGLPQRGYKDGV